LEDGNVNFAFNVNRAEYTIPVMLLLKALREVPSFCSEFCWLCICARSCITRGRGMWRRGLLLKMSNQGLTTINTLCSDFKLRLL
jgi:hypothetical protein